MKNIFLSVLVVTTLLAAGLGGTFAHFSDTEESRDNTIQVGSIDLKIQVKTPLGLLLDDPNVPTLLTVIDMQPCDSEDRTFIVHNTGQPENDPCDLYIHFKNVLCEDVPDKLGNPKPEPEVVAEQGGMVGQVEVPGIGDIECFVTQHMNVTIYYPWDQATGEGEVVFNGKMDEIVCSNILLGDLPKCNEREVHVVFHLQDIDEDQLIADGILDPPAVPAPGDGGYFNGDDPEIMTKCWDKWPTNALMKDKITFDILFSLVQSD